MPWMIQHRHRYNVTDPEPKDYAVLRGDRNGEKLTRIMCPDRACREEFYIVGHDMFSGAEQMPSGLPPGFVIPGRAT